LPISLISLTHPVNRCSQTLGPSVLSIFRLNPGRISS
jgi:hypothetical protein